MKLHYYQILAPYEIYLNCFAAFIQTLSPIRQSNLLRKIYFSIINILEPFAYLCDYVICVKGVAFPGSWY